MQTLKTELREGRNAVRSTVKYGRDRENSMVWLYLLFFSSGFPALIYQIVWQRALFAIYGINVESVTVVVSAFMLGLGVGSLLGGTCQRGQVSRYWPSSELRNWVAPRTEFAELSRWRSGIRGERGAPYRRDTMRNLAGSRGGSAILDVCPVKDAGRVV